MMTWKMLLVLASLGLALGACGVKGKPLPPLVPSTMGDGRLGEKKSPAPTNKKPAPRRNDQ